MKKIIFLTCLLASLLTGGVNAQFSYPKLVITGPQHLEVGEEGTYTAKVIYNGLYLDAKYVWYTDTKPIGKSGKSGIQGGIKNNTNTFSSEPITIETYDDQNSMTFKWGDNNICYDKIYVEVIFYPATSGKKHLYANLPVDIKCVLPPRIEGVNPVNLCCADTIEYCDNSPGKQNDWLWKVTGDGADSVIYGDGDTSGQGKKCIKVAVNPSGDFTVSAISRRKSWKTQTFTRKDSILVERNQPSTSAITSISGYDGVLFTCRGAVTTLCVEPVCGMSGVNWNLGDAFEIIGDENAACIQVVPRTHYCIKS